MEGRWPAVLGLNYAEAWEALFFRVVQSMENNCPGRQGLWFTEHGLFLLREADEITRGRFFCDGKSYELIDVHTL